jgi:hypothetical protein
MDIKRLLSYGYLFKELPPPFYSLTLGSNYDLISGLTFGTNKCIEFSIPKGQYTRRILQLPHPGNFIQIVKHICEPSNWHILVNHFSGSAYSHSKVVENLSSGTKVLSKDNRAIRTNYEKVSDSKEKTIIESYDMLYELKIDIAKFYPSIYSHSLVWAILGKDRAKALWRLKSAKTTEHDFNLYDFADKLDDFCRFAQDNQSVGIPIGPDTSHIIAEIIGTYFDKQLKSKFPDIKAFRYFDDYYLYVDSEERVQMALKYIQQIFAELQLSMNESKLKIQRFPFGFQEDWIKEINDVHFNDVRSSNIKQYFSTLFDLANKYPDNSSTIFNYGLKTFEKRTTIVPPETWKVFESLLLKSILVEPSILDIASRIFETYKTQISKDKIKNVMIKILEYHSELNHHYETVWALWIFKQLNMGFPLKLSEKIINSADNFSILLLLDINSFGQISDGGLTNAMKQSITDILDLGQTTDWMLYYEAVEEKRWINAAHRSEFDPFLRASITFYDSTRSMKIFDLPKKK